MFRKGRGSLFVVLEGVDGAGKSTLVETLREYFGEDEEIKGRFKRIIYCQEPSKESTRFCEELRNLVLRKDCDISTKTRALVFLASRSDHMEKLIEPELAKDGTLIICDRFYLSTLVYQGMENPEYAEFIEKAQEFITKVVPDITLFLNISKDVFRERYREKILLKTNNVLDSFAFDRFEEMVGFYRKVMEEQKKQTGKIIVLDANGGVKRLKEGVKKILIDFVNDR